MHASQSHYDSSTAIRTDLGAIFVSLELSRATWLVTSLSPGNGEKMSKHAVQGGDVGELLSRFAIFKRKLAAVLATFFQSLRSRPTAPLHKFEIIDVRPWPIGPP
jgi:transposase